MGQGVTREACKKLIQQCSGLDFFPAATEVRTLLVDTLHRVAVSEDHATRMINRWLEVDCVETDHAGRVTRRAPTVDVLVTLSRIVPVTQVVPKGCEACHFTGWKTVELQQRDGSWTTASKRCDCAKGQAFAEMDKQRLAEARK